MPRKVNWLFFLLVFVLSPKVWAQNEILNIRYWVAPDHTRLVIDTSRESLFQIEKTARHVAIKIENASLPPHLWGLQVFNKPGLDAVFLTASETSEVLVELTIPPMLEAHIFKLKRFRDKPDRIVVDIALADAELQQRKSREETRLKKTDRVIVIDPGHGGDDPGAVGKEGLYEKNVVLDISRKLRDILNQKPGYRAFLTRDGDYYVPFKKRLTIAREYGADLFLSVHADASTNRSARGSSVYCLSSGAASSEAARILARNENLADIIGGVPSGDEGEVSDPIVLDMFQNHVINQSRSFGRSLLKELAAVNKLKFKDVQGAPFYVLRLPEIPSVLLETAFISNPQEESLLRKESFKRRLGIAMAKAIMQFLPPLERSDAEGTIFHTIRRGETLYSIARKYRTMPAVIKELNHLQRPDLLYVGSRLVVPSKKPLRHDNARSD